MLLPAKRQGRFSGTRHESPDPLSGLSLAGRSRQAHAARRLQAPGVFPGRN